MQTVFSERLLAELRTRHDENGELEVERCGISHNDGRLLDSYRTGREVQPLGAENPDDNPDPDDCLPALLSPLPSEMPASWWMPLLFGKPSDVVNPEDARLAMALIRGAPGRES